MFGKIKCPKHVCEVWHRPVMQYCSNKLSYYTKQFLNVVQVYSCGILHGVNLKMLKLSCLLSIPYLFRILKAAHVWESV